MNFIDQLDPELRAMVEKMPTDRPIDLSQIPKARAEMKKMVAAMLGDLPPIDGVTGQDRDVPGAKGDPAVRVRVYRPDGSVEPAARSAMDSRRRIRDGRHRTR